MRKSTTGRKRGFTLVELMIVVAIISVLAALAIAGVRKYIATAQTVEAKQVIGAISRSASMQYERERDMSQIFPAGGVSAANTHLLCTSANPVPANINQVSGRKYQPTEAVGADFMVGSPLAGWPCLGFDIKSPIHFQYSYHVGGGYVSQGLPSAPIPVGVPTAAEAFEAAAQGDLDGDGVSSTMARVGEVRSGQLIMSTHVYSHNELE